LSNFYQWRVLVHIYLATFPLYPPPLQGRGKIILKEGLTPLLNTPAKLFPLQPTNKNGRLGALAPIGRVGGKKERNLKKRGWGGEQPPKGEFYKGEASMAGGWEEILRYIVADQTVCYTVKLTTKDNYNQKGVQACQIQPPSRSF
jgi:hypothetical protein